MVFIENLSKVVLKLFWQLVVALLRHLKLFFHFVTKNNTRGVNSGCEKLEGFSSFKWCYYPWCFSLTVTIHFSIYSQRVWSISQGTQGTGWAAPWMRGQSHSHTLSTTWDTSQPTEHVFGWEEETWVPGEKIPREGENMAEAGIEPRTLKVRGKCTNI